MSNTPSFADILAESSLDGANATYLEGLYEAFLVDPKTVPETWQAVFAQFTPEPNDYQAHSSLKEAFVNFKSSNPSVLQEPSASFLFKQGRVLEYIQAYRLLGHLHAEINPIKTELPKIVPELELLYYGLSAQDLNTVFDVGSLSGQKMRSLAQIQGDLQSIYSQSIASEYMHIADSLERAWVQTEVEARFLHRVLTKPAQTRILHALIQAEGLEKYLSAKYPGVKRFSLEGCDSSNVVLDQIIAASDSYNTQEIVIGMAHRGRLNVLVNIMGKSPGTLFDEFEGKHAETLGSGDVKYHLGYSSNIQNPNNIVHLSLAYNPSHLEIVSPVVLGSVRARLERQDKLSHQMVLPILIHGDSAMSGQGVVMETLNMSQTRAFHVGGSIHLITNNQIGFTTDDPQDMRSTLYCSDVAKMIQAPVFHVNADDPEAVALVAQLALDYRMKFHKDVVIDLVGYRRHGHNEADEPAATQPKLYQAIRAKPTCLSQYLEKLKKSGAFTPLELEQAVQAYKDKLDARAPTVAPNKMAAERNSRACDWPRYQGPNWRDSPPTAVPLETLKQLGQQLTRLPTSVVLHARVAKIYADRSKMFEEGSLDWGMAETLSYASLLHESYPIRITGQDAGRGTFFHRHAVLHNQQDDSLYIPLQQIGPRFSIFDSFLSELAVLGFEYGYAATEPSGLVIWEAQFGDFANGAQTIIDQFISSGEQKWQRLSGLTLFLPHGQEGQGPEHSSARLERYLQLCAEENMQVCLPTTPAQIFHVLRRQVLRAQRKPLIICSPKSGLRHKLAVSTLKELSEGSFQTVISEAPSDQIERLVISSGKVCLDLLEAQNKHKVPTVALIRLEQLYPFPDSELKAVLATYPKAKTIVWTQEEPQNQGAWHFIQEHLKACLTQGQTLHYTGRLPMAAPAVGHLHTHQIQQEALVNAALGLDLQ